MFFDIGANIGKWSIANSPFCEKIIAVEAIPDTFARLQSHTSSEPKIVCLNYAVCNVENEVTFYNCQSDTLSTLNVNWLTDAKSRFYGQKYYPVVCKTIKIDELIQRYGMPQLIKVDVEAGEYDCILSLTQKVDLLCFEWASELNDISFKTIDYLQTLGFSQFYLQYEDLYTFRPDNATYQDISEIKKKLKETTPKKEWGMIWCK
jgi:FkbM family methyltransferase